MRGFLLGIMLATAPSVASAAPEPPTAMWTATDGGMAARTSGIVIPTKAGTLTNSGTRDMGNAGQDLIAQYLSADGKILGTIFLYAPSRPDPSLTFLATNETILRRLGPDAKRVDDQLVTVAGVANAGRRLVYSGSADAKLSGDPDGRLSSTATLLRAGDWVMKIRVSGPMSRADEIARNLDALTAGIRFPQDVAPLTQRSIALTECPSSMGRPSSMERPSIKIVHPPTSEIRALALALNTEADGSDGTIDRAETSTITAACREQVKMVNDIALQSYRVTGTAGGPYQPRQFLLYGDAGIMIVAFEDMAHPGHYYVARHSIGRTLILGRTSGLPSMAELESVLFSPDKQPMIAGMTRNHLAKKVAIDINCNLIAEGCTKAK